MPRVRFRTPSPPVIVAMTALILAATGVAFAAIPDSGGVIHGCYDTTKGSLRVIDNSNTHCTNKETALNWSQQGPAGPQGPQGPQGPAGPSGGSGGGQILSSRVTLAASQVSSDDATPDLVLRVPGIADLTAHCVDGSAFGGDSNNETFYIENKSDHTLNVDVVQEAGGGAFDNGWRLAPGQSTRDLQSQKSNPLILTGPNTPDPTDPGGSVAVQLVDETDSGTQITTLTFGGRVEASSCKNHAQAIVSP